MKNYFERPKLRSLNWLWFIPLAVLVICGIVLLNAFSFGHFKAWEALCDFCVWGVDQV